jgi:hypothetical protein
MDMPTWAGDWNCLGYDGLVGLAFFFEGKLVGLAGCLVLDRLNPAMLSWFQNLNQLTRHKPEMRCSAGWAGGFDSLRPNEARSVLSLFLGGLVLLLLLVASDMC